MSKKELEELKKFVIANLGKSIKGNSDYNFEELMIVGYSLDGGILNICNVVILSLTSNIRWSCLGKEDIILLHSPLNKSFTYMDINLLKNYINEQAKRIEQS